MNTQQLKNSILQEAIEGRLVSQDPDDEPASVLLDKIRKEKARLVKEGKLKKKDLEEIPISGNEIPFEIPKSWEWCRVSDISESFIGLTYKPSDVSNKGWIVLRSSNIQDGNLDFCDIVRVNVDVPEKLHVRQNDIIICARNGSKKLVGKSALVKEVTEPMTFGAFMAICRTSFYRYMAMYLLSPLFFDQLRKESDTTTINQLTQKNFNKYLVPLPPLAEQKRIVEKIEELLPKVEEYGKAQEALDKLNEELPERLKKSILQEAIEGRLVPQDPNDEPASVLLDKIRKEKVKLVKEGKLKKKDLEEIPISEDEKPFEIPESWEWVKLGDITEIARGGSPRPIKDYLTDDPNGLNWIKIGDTDKGGKYINSCKEKIKPEGLKKTRMVHPGDFLLTNSMSFGRPYITNIEGCIHDGWLMISPYAGVFDQSYLYYVLSSAFAHKQFCDKVAGAVVQNLNSDKVADSIVPLPPLAEQKRIVAKIEQLMKEIDKLKA